MILHDVYQVLTDDDKLVHGDQFAIASIAATHIWGPCDSFLGKYVRDVSQRGRIIFRRPIAKDEAAV